MWFVLLTLLGCGSQTPKRDLGALPDEEIAELTIAFMTQMVEAGSPHLGDCTALAPALQAVVDEHKDLLAVTKKYHDDPVKRQWFDEHYGERVRPMGMWMQMEVLPRCGDHPGVKAVISAME